MAGDHLMRCTTGLSPAHVELISLIAAQAVEDFLAESEQDQMPEFPLREEAQC